MSKRNAKAYEIERGKPTDKMAAGAYWFMIMPPGCEDAGKVIGIEHGCPCGCGQRSTIFFKDEDHDGWAIEHPFPEATLSPSLGLFLGQNPFHWHGYLRDGVFEEC